MKNKRYPNIFYILVFIFIVIIGVVVLSQFPLIPSQSLPTHADEKKRLHRFEITTSNLFSPEEQERLKNYNMYFNRVVTNMPRTDLKDVVHYPVYYINMDRDNYRRDFIENQIKMYNINPAYRIRGVDVSNPNDMQIEWEYPHTDTPHVRGCLASHIRAIQTAYNNGDSIALIIEDDIHFGLLGYIDFSLPDLVSVAPPDWQIISLHNLNCNGTYNPRLRFMYRGLHTSVHCWSTAAYLINRSAMRQILDAASSKSNPESIHIRPISPGFPRFGDADGWIYDVLKSYYMHPNLLYPYEADNIIDESKPGWYTSNPPQLIGIPDVVERDSAIV